MIIDLNILKRLGARFGIIPISLTPIVQKLLNNTQIAVKAPAGLEPLFTGGGYIWDDEINGYKFGNQKMFLFPTGIVVWAFKDVLARGLNLNSIEKWVSGDAEYPMGKANAFFIVYGKLTGQDLGEGATAGDNVPDGETEPGDGGGLATADDENAPPFSKQDIQKMLKGEFPEDAPEKSKASMDTAIPGEPSSPMSGPPPSRLAKGNPPQETGSEAEKIIKTLYKQAHINPKDKLSKQHPIRLDSDTIIDLYQRAKKMEPEEGEKLISFLKSGIVKPLEEGKIAKRQLDGLLEHIVSGIVDEVEEAKKKAKAKKSKTKPKAPSSQPKDSDIGSGDINWEPPEHSQMDWEPSAEQHPIAGRNAESQWLEDLANKLWKDPEDIGHSNQGWKVTKSVPHADGTKTYLLTLRKTYHKSRVFINKNGQWFWIDPVNRHQGWQEVEGPQTQPSIEQEGNKKKWTVPFKGKNELEEMTTTSGGGGSSAGTPGYSVPGAFGKKLNNRKGHIEVLGYKMTPEGEEEYKKSADKLYESIKKNVRTMMSEIVHKPVGKCPKCKKGIYSHDAMVCSHCKSRLPTKPKSKPKTLDVSPLQQEGHFDGLRNPYIPGGVEPLQQESAMGQLGPNFNAAQQEYDAQMPPEEEPELECPECGGQAHLTQNWRKGRFYKWNAKCDKCGNQWGDDNLDDVRGET